VADRRVVVIEPDGEFHAVDFAAELNNTWGVKHIGTGAVHAIGKFGAAVKVAIIDSGVDYNHVELSTAVMGGRDFVNNDDDPWDDNGHGTHVAGTVAAVADGAGVVGVAPAVELYALKVLGANGSGSFSNVIAALEWCKANDIQVTNNSYGSSLNPGTLVEAAFNAAYSAGVVHIAAAGNSGNSSGTGSNVIYPARYGAVTAVAATNSSDTRASFSSTGSAVELSAPGVGIRSSIPGGGYADWSGTSMASPHVAGVAALVIAEGVSVPNDVRTVLSLTAIDLGSAGPDTRYGFGLVDAAAAVALAADYDGGGGGGGGDPTLMTVGLLQYSTAGGRSGNRDLRVAVPVFLVETSAPVSGATVAITLNRNGAPIGTGSATTGSNGTVTFTLKNAPSGRYTTLVNSVTATGLTWNGNFQDNGFTK
jgi:subtilisin